MTEKIFVSYAHQDRKYLKGLEQQLRKHGIVSGGDVVLIDPHEIQPGENIREALRNQIRSATKVVIIVSKNSADSEWVNYEAGMASALEKPIVIIGGKGSGKTVFAKALGNVQSIESEEADLLLG